MLNNLTPQYLSSLVPPPASNLSRYNLRNSNNLQTIAARTNQYFYSFLSSSIRAWNSLPGEAKETDSVNSFKSYLKKDKRNIPKHYYTGTRKAVVATKLVSLNALYNEIGLESLEKRRIDHKLTLGYIMLNNLTPQYLSSLVPPPASNLSRYNLRNSNNLQTIAARTNQYFYSFLSSSIRAWDSLPGEAKETDSVNSFKSYLKKDKRNIPKHYYTGTRKAQILHTRLKTNCM